MPSESATATVRNPVQRARVSNGRKLMEGLDGRGRRARRFRDVLADLSRDLGREPNAAERALLRQTATMIAASEVAQVRVLNGEAGTDLINETVRLSNLVTRNLIALKLKHKGTSGPDDLATYLAGKANGPDE